MEKKELRSILEKAFDTETVYEDSSIMTELKDAIRKSEKPLLRTTGIHSDKNVSVSVGKKGDKEYIDIHRWKKGKKPSDGLGTGRYSTEHIRLTWEQFAEVREIFEEVSSHIS